VLIRGVSKDITSGDQAGELSISVALDGFSREFFTINGYNGIVGQGEIILNEESNDVDFRVESDNRTNAFFVEGNTGNVGIGTLLFDASAVGVTAILNGTAPAAGTANQSYIYAKDVTASSEMHVMDEAGNETQISPHDPETGKWIFYSKNVETGRVVRVEMEELIFDLAKMMSKKTGKKYVYDSDVN